MPHPDPDRLTLAALPAEPPDPEVVAHLRVCPECRAHVAALRHTVELARLGETTEDRPGPPAAVWDAIATATGVAAGPAPPKLVDPPARRGRRRPLALAAAAGLAAGLVLGWAGAAWPDRAEPAVATTPLAPLATAATAPSGAVGLAEHDGHREVVVEVADPAGPPAGGYLEVWLMSAAGDRLYALGALVPDGTVLRGRYPLPEGLSLDAWPIVDVSLEPLDGDPRHSGTSLLRGPVR